MKKRTVFIPIKEDSIGHSSSVVGDAITTWSRNLIKFQELKLWTGNDY